MIRSLFEHIFGYDNSLQEENERLVQENEYLRAENIRLTEENVKLKNELEEARRSANRQACRFGRKKGKDSPKRPGRKRGKGYGKRKHRPAPEKVDRIIDVPIHTGVVDQDGFPVCPDCGESLTRPEIHPQYQIEIPPPPKPIVTRFNVETACCSCCGRRFQGRHPEQGSDALHAANIHFGPRLISLATELKYDYGLTFGKVKRFVSNTYGIDMARATPARAAQRVANKGEPTYHQLVLRLRGSKVVCADETGWRINRESSWLWVFTNDDVAVYTIEPGRGHEVVEKILGKDFDGVLSSDCFPAYDPVNARSKQKCNAHLIKRCREIEDMKTGGAIRFSRQVASVLKAGISLHRRRGHLSPHGFKTERGKIEAALDRLLAKNLTDPDNARLARLLRKHRAHLFTYLYDEAGEIDPTNNMAERDIRPGVITRKCGACNRSAKGAKATSIITSILRTCQKKGVAFGKVVEDLLRSPDRIVHPFVSSDNSRPP